ncbi:MAG: DUF5050 domain-containing protein [Christensenellaceae bacterium]|jgi:hypothetical protein
MIKKIFIMCLMGILVFAVGCSSTEAPDPTPIATEATEAPTKTPTATPDVQITPEPEPEPIEAVNTEGNTNGNILNGGHVAAQGDWIYFAYNSYADGGISTGISKMKNDGTDVQQICSDNAEQINVVGDWVYYSNFDDNYVLYKVKTDGTERQLVCPDVELNYAWNVHVIGDWIYYTTHFDRRPDEMDSFRAVPCKTKADGTERQDLGTGGAAITFIVGDLIYYYRAAHDILYNIKTDGTEEQEQHIDGWGGSDGIYVDGDWVYYPNSDDGDTLYKIKVDGTEKKQVCPDSTIVINIVDDWIYYSNSSDNASIYKVKTDGTERQQISTDSADEINIADGWIYFVVAGADGQETLYRIRADGTEKQPVPMPDIVIEKEQADGAETETTAKAEDVLNGDFSYFVGTYTQNSQYGTYTLTIDKNGVFFDESGTSDQLYDPEISTEGCYAFDYGDDYSNASSLGFFVFPIGVGTESFGVITDTNTIRITAFRGDAPSGPEEFYYKDGKTPTPHPQPTTELGELVFQGKERNYTRDELLNKSKYDLSILRNGMFALSGKEFVKNMEVKAFFEGCSWYAPDTSDDDVILSRFNNYQKSNIDLISEVEKELGYK